MTKTRDLSDFLVEGGVLDKPLGTPHIVPGVLHPSYNGAQDKQIDGTTALAASTTGPAGSTVTSSKYGTVQSDGRMYYYTDIKGSKPIKDPRIGAHFGSQRHKFRSIQLLEQETATHGKSIYSIDGREFIRVLDDSTKVSVLNGNHGNFIQITDSPANCFIEVVGYFNNLNLSLVTDTNRCTEVDISIDGTVTVDGSTTLGGDTTASSPLMSRYVDAGSIFNTGLTSSLGIHTAKIECKASGHFPISGIELIAQDTSSDANKLKIQIPAQEVVVGFGKKFSVSAAATHYDPFTTMSYGGSGTTASALANLIDTATSLGMDNWKAGTSNYHRPWNGGRVIKWVDSAGTIKTSVTMIPPNAQNAGGTASNAVSNAHQIAGTNDDTINFDTTTIANASDLSEVAKTFYTQEYGNGGANAGTLGANYADASMLSAKDTVGYVMDDGLTSLSAVGVVSSVSGIHGEDNSSASYWHTTFIGTGISIFGTGNTHGGTDNFKWYIDGIEVKNMTSGFSFAGWHTVAKNLPYGTHILKVLRVTANTSGQRHGQISIEQPKMPPIPEDACILADYMLMADFVMVGAAGVGPISKGVRRQDGSRDVSYDHNTTMGGTAVFGTAANGLRVSFGSSNAASKGELSAFCTNQVHYGYAVADRYMTYKINGSTVTPTAKTGSADAAFYSNTGNAQTLGLNTHSVSGTAQASSAYVDCIDIVSPIHTSHHYQPFETPFLNELVGGDRNMEQNNLVCSSDGKTWDEITRDTSYIGNLVCHFSHDDDTVWTTINIFTDWRGLAHGTNFGNKDFAIGYDRLICLVGGEYELNARTYSMGSSGTANNMAWMINGTNLNINYTGDHSRQIDSRSVVQLKRGDYVQLKGSFGADTLNYNDATIIRL